MFTHEELVRAVSEAGRDGQPFTSAAVRSCLGLNTRDRSELTRFQNRFRAFQKAAPDAIEKIGNNSYRLKQIARPIVALAAEPEPTPAADDGKGLAATAQPSVEAKPSVSAEPKASASEPLVEVPALEAKPNVVAESKASASEQPAEVPALEAKPSFFAELEASASEQPAEEAAAEPSVETQPSFFAEPESPAPAEVAAAVSDTRAEPVETRPSATAASRSETATTRQDALAASAAATDSSVRAGSVAALLTAAATAIETPEPTLEEDEEPTQPYVAPAPARPWQWLGKRVAEFFGRA